VDQQRFEERALLETLDAHRGALDAREAELRAAEARLPAWAGREPLAAGVARLSVASQEAPRPRTSPASHREVDRPFHMNIHVGATARLWLAAVE
jgi:hypothetical protein